MRKTLLLAAVGLSACGYSGVVVVGSQAVVLRDGFFGAVRSINACNVTDAGLGNCKLAEDKEMTAGNPNAPSSAAPASETPAAPAATEPLPPPPAPEPAKEEPKGKGKGDKGAKGGKDKGGKKKKK